MHSYLILNLYTVLYMHTYSTTVHQQYTTADLARIFSESNNKYYPLKISAPNFHQNNWLHKKEKKYNIFKIVINKDDNMKMNINCKKIKMLIRQLL